MTAVLRDQLDEEYAELIRFQELGNPEVDHSMADNVLIDLLVKLGYAKTVDAWNEVKKWYA